MSSESIGLCRESFKVYTTLSCAARATNATYAEERTCINPSRHQLIA
ncbi:MAG TPA: hypothetical protein VD884_15785 [Ohtaekwangia sp.]|nr:hypothetical protein [Ohtaekwangia sp.]